MKKIILLLALVLFSWPFAGTAADPNVDVRLNTPAGQIEVTNQPPPRPVVVVPVQPAPQKVVVQNETTPPPQSGGCQCNLLPGSSSAWSFLSLVPVFSLFFLKRKKQAQ